MANPKDSPRMRDQLCHRCVHRDVAADTAPCVNCWNPPGDMFREGPKLIPSVPPSSYWQRGFEQGYAGEMRPGYNMHLPGYANGYRWGRIKYGQSQMKDHQIAHVVDELVEIASVYHDPQQLRERISRVVSKLVKG